MNINNMIVDDVQSMEFVKNKSGLYDLHGILNCMDIVRPNEKMSIEFESKNFKLNPSLHSVDNNGHMETEFNFALSKNESFRKILSEKRMEELRKTIGIYLEANEKIPNKLLDEYNNLWR